MGGSQQNAFQRQMKQSGKTRRYDMDIRLLEFFNVVPSSFSHQTQQLIQEVEDIRSKVPEHTLETYLVSSLDQHFSKYNTINEEVFESQSYIDSVLKIDESRFGFQEWWQLRDKESFLVLLQHLQELFQVQRRMESMLNGQVKAMGRGQSLDMSLNSESMRYRLQAEKGGQMQQGLLIRLIYHYYLILLRTNANSGEKAVLRFHTDTGKLLCYMVYSGYLNLQQLFELCYLLIYMDKHPHSIKSKLDIINHRYHAQCLSNTYTINVPQSSIKVKKTAARLYLDQLYLTSLREAQDPDIVPSDDTLLPIKVFPITKVKEKSKN